MVDCSIRSKWEFILAMRQHVPAAATGESVSRNDDDTIIMELLDLVTNPSAEPADLHPLARLLLVLAGQQPPSEGLHNQGKDTAAARSRRRGKGRV
jgi:hypothetical protein